ncbi:MAG: hypothetical protein IMZ62_14150 [Chloroflexi bacterium]|nr:hypothetical protein [Chloroflexota bacterium]
MAVATYSTSLAAELDHVRFALGDTDTTAPLIVDATITALLTEFGYAEALAQCADALVALFGQKPDTYDESGGLKFSWRERIKAWQKVADNARSGKVTAPGATRSVGIHIANTTIQATTDTNFRSD